METDTTATGCLCVCVCVQSTVIIIIIIILLLSGWGVGSRETVVTVAGSIIYNREKLTLHSFSSFKLTGICGYFCRM